MTDTLIPGIEVLHGDCVEQMTRLAERGVMVDSIVTDPPYELSFMSKKWDGTGIANNVAMWQLALSILKPGGHLVSFGGTRTYHRMACAIEDAGFEIRDCIRSLNGQDHYPAWVYGSGFPKAEQWTQAKADAGNAESAMMVEAGFEGWARGGIKPAWEPIVLARKPLSESGVAANVLRHGTGGLNIGACRISTDENLNGRAYSGSLRQRDEYSSTDRAEGAVPLSRLNRGTGEYIQPTGRFPSNLIHDGSDEVLAAFERFGSSKSTKAGSFQREMTSRGYKGGGLGQRTANAHEAVELEKPGYGDTGTAARFFMACKPSEEEIVQSSLASLLCKSFVDIIVGNGNGVDECLLANIAETRRQKEVGEDLCDTVQKSVVGKARLDPVDRQSQPNETVCHAGAGSQPSLPKIYTTAQGNAQARPSKPTDPSAISAESLSDSCETPTVPNPVRVRIRTVTDLMEVFTNATVSELKQLSETLITAIQSIESACLRGSPPTKLSLTLNHAECVAILKPTGITQITISHWKSSGCVEPVTFSITPKNSGHGEAVSASRFTYSAKASKLDRCDSKHPTVKPINLMRYLCRLITPPGGIVLDPFAGSGTTLAAAYMEGFRAIGIEREAEYIDDIRRRIAALAAAPQPARQGGLFADLDAAE